MTLKFKTEYIKAIVAFPIICYLLCLTTLPKLLSIFIALIFSASLLLKLPEIILEISSKFLFIFSPTISFFIIEFTNYSYRAPVEKIPLITIPVITITITLAIYLLIKLILKKDTPAIILALVYSLILFVTVTIAGIDYIPLFFNYLILLSVQSLFLLIFRNYKWSIYLLTLLATLLSLLNSYVVRFRGFQINWNDIKAARTALNVAGNYNFALSKTETILILIFVSTLLISNILSNKKIKINYINLMISCTSITLFFAIIFNTGILKHYNIRPDSYFENPNGFVLNFFITHSLYDLNLPSDYSLDKIQEISDSIKQVNITNGTQPINIISIMNESFSDLEYSGLIELTNINNLTDNTIKGTAYTSVIGYNTSNSEYEFLTNNSMAFMHNQLAPFMTDYITDNTPSIVDILNRIGYKTVAYHSYWSTGWNRVETYNNLKFKEQLFLDTVFESKSIDKYNNYPSDKFNHEVIIDIYENKLSNEKLFIHNVTMQNHSPNPNYPESIKKSDEDIMILIDYFSKIDEPTMIVMYGDHQLRMPDNFYKQYLGNSLNKLSPEQAEQIYTVPFFIWTNYDIQEQTDIKLSLNYLSILMLETANIPLTKYQLLQKELYNYVPIIHGTGYWTKDGKFYQTFDSLPGNIKEKVNEYKLVQLHSMLDIDNLNYELFINSNKKQ